MRVAVYFNFIKTGCNGIAALRRACRTSNRPQSPQEPHQSGSVIHATVSLSGLQKDPRRRCSDGKEPENNAIFGQFSEGGEEKEWRARQGSNLWPLAPEAESAKFQTADWQALTEGEDSACTTACTRTPESMHADLLEALAAALRELGPEERATLAELLTRDA